VNRLRNQEGSVDFARRSRSQVESEQIVLMLKEMLKEGSKDRLLDQIAALQKRSLLLGSFIDEIKAKLHLNQSISDESVFTKLIRFLDVNTEK
jgi:uncharacterized protein YjgD (DUF1641 family)